MQKSTCSQDITAADVQLPISDCQQLVSTNVIHVSQFKVLFVTIVIFIFLRFEQIAESFKIVVQLCFSCVDDI